MDFPVLVTDDHPDFQERLSVLFDSCGGENFLHRLEMRNILGVEATICLDVQEALSLPAKAWLGLNARDLMQSQLVRSAHRRIASRLGMTLYLLGIYQHAWPEWGEQNVRLIGLTLGSYLTVLPRNAWLLPDNVTMQNNTLPDDLRLPFTSMVTTAAALLPTWPMQFSDTAHEEGDDWQEDWQTLMSADEDQ